MLLAAALASTFLLYYIVHPGVARPARLDANFGFGADWVCKDSGKGDPTCVKKQPSN
jgi:hypothetical protein